MIQRSYLARAQELVEHAERLLARPADSHEDATAMNTEVQACAALAVAYMALGEYPWKTAGERAAAFEADPLPHKRAAA